jgi:hypothetical protein
VNSFWPWDLDLSDTSSPLDILRSASREWAEKSQGALALLIQEAVSTNGNTLLIVHAKHVPSNRTINLFSVVHRPGSPYPAKIQPREQELPDILKKSYYVPGSVDIANALGRTSGRHVTNEWVCDTPSEFRSELEKAFNLGTVKSEVLSLVSGSGSSFTAKDEKEIDKEAAGGRPDDVES